MIKNKAMRENEKIWIETMLSGKFLYRDELIDQINGAEIFREYTDFYISIKFKAVNNMMRKIKTDITVPVEMRVYQTGKVPIQFLLHIIQGYVSELEVFNADSSKMDSHINFEDARVEIIINGEIITEYEPDIQILQNYSLQVPPIKKSKFEV